MLYVNLGLHIFKQETAVSIILTLFAYPFKQLIIVHLVPTYVFIQLDY